MRKLLIAAVLVLSLSSLTFAIGGGVYFFADYTSVSMSKANSQIDYIENNLSNNNPFGVNPTETKLGSGFLGGLEANIDVPIVDIFAIDAGLRGGYLYAFPGSIKLNATNIMGTGYNLDLNATFNGSLIPIEIGVAGKLNIPATGISASLGFYGGLGMASVSQEMKLTTNIPAGMGPSNDDVTVPYSGTCPVFEIIGNLSATISVISIGLDLGYRMADASQMKATKTVNDSNFNIAVNKGDAMKDANGDGGNVDIDFSGLIVGLKVGVSF